MQKPLVHLLISTVRRLVSFGQSLDLNSITDDIADDDDIETAISIRLIDTAQVQQVSPAGEDVPMQESVPVAIFEGVATNGHGKTSDGEQACCAMHSAEMVDCAACLASMTQALLESTSPDELTVLSTVIDALEDAGSEGLSKQQLLVRCYTRQIYHYGR